MSQFKFHHQELLSYKKQMHLQSTLQMAAHLRELEAKQTAVERLGEEVHHLAQQVSNTRHDDPDYGWRLLQHAQATYRAWQRADQELQTSTDAFHQSQQRRDDLNGEVEALHLLYQRQQDEYRSKLTAHRQHQLESRSLTKWVEHSGERRHAEDHPT